MTASDTPEPKPNVEAIINQIREDVQASELPTIPDMAKSAELDSNLSQLLATANAQYAVGHARPRGLKGVLYRILTVVGAPLVSDINRFNSLSVRLFNKLNGMLAGNDTATESDLLANTRRRIDLLTDLGKRVDTYDRLDLDARLRRIEEQLAKQQGQESA
jgi:hypothetical protein